MRRSAKKLPRHSSLRFEDYAKDPTIRYGRDKVEKALRDVVGYRVYRDLRRGWRINAPNLEQCGLIEIDYAELDAVSAMSDLWKALHPVLGNASAEDRKVVCRTLLDFIRRDLCIEVDYLERDTQDRIKRNSLMNCATRGHLIPWKNSISGRWRFPVLKVQHPDQIDAAVHFSAWRFWPVSCVEQAPFPVNPKLDVSATREIIARVIRGTAAGKHCSGMCAEGRARAGAGLSHQLRRTHLARR